MSQWGSGSCVICEFPQVTFVTSKPAGHGLLFCGLENRGWIVQLVSVMMSSAVTQEGTRKRGLIPGSSRSHAGDHLRRNAVITRDKKNRKSKPKLLRCRGGGSCWGL